MPGFKFKYIIKGLIFISIFYLITLGYNFLYGKLDKNTNYNVYLWDEVYNGEPFDIVYVGDSQVFSGINPYMLDDALNKINFNLCAPGQKILDAYYTLNEIYKYHNPEYVFLDINTSRMYASNLVQYSFNIFLQLKPSYDKFEYFFKIDGADYKLRLIFPFIGRDNINIISNITKYIKIKLFKNQDNEEAMLRLTAERSNNYKGKGFFPYKKGFLNRPPFLQVGLWQPKAVDSESMNLYKKTIELCVSNGSKVILFTMPYSENYLKNMRNYQGYYDFTSDFARSHGADFIDFNYLKPQIYMPNKAHFYDGFHFLEEGAEVFTNAISGLLFDYINDSLAEDKYFYKTYKEIIEGREEWKIETEGEVIDE